MQTQPSAVLPESLLHLRLQDKKLPDPVAYSTNVRDTLSGRLSGILYLEHLDFVASGNEDPSEAHFTLQRDCHEKGLDIKLFR